jgi:HSP20 family protein
MRRTGQESGIWSPFNELDKLRREINRVFERRGWLSGSTEEAWVPAVDIYQDHERVTVQAEMSGFKKEDIEISIEGQTLTISGQRVQDMDTPGKDAYQSERYYGRFQRQVTLPEGVDPERADASYKDGVLCIHFPKTEQSKRKQIPVKDS